MPVSTAYRPCPGSTSDRCLIHIQRPNWPLLPGRTSTNGELLLESWSVTSGWLMSGQPWFQNCKWNWMPDWLERNRQRALQRGCRWLSRFTLCGSHSIVVTTRTAYLPIITCMFLPAGRMPDTKVPDCYHLAQTVMPDGSRFKKTQGNFLRSVAWFDCPHHQLEMRPNPWQTWTRGMWSSLSHLNVWWYLQGFSRHSIFNDCQEDSSSYRNEFAKQP
jgi:hypothetical protein